MLERESAKVAADLSSKLASAELAKQESLALVEELEKQLLQSRAENERLKQGPVRAVKRTGEEAQAERALTGANLFVAKRTMLRSVSAPLTDNKTSGVTWLTGQTKSSRIALNGISESEVKAAEVKKDEMLKPKVEPERPKSEAKPKEAVKAKKERRSSIFSNFSKRRKDEAGEAGATASGSASASAIVKQKKSKKKSLLRDLGHCDG